VSNYTIRDIVNDGKKRLKAYNDALGADKSFTTYENDLWVDDKIEAGRKIAEAFKIAKIRKQIKDNVASKSAVQETTKETWFSSEMVNMMQTMDDHMMKLEYIDEVIEKTPKSDKSKLKDLNKKMDLFLRKIMLLKNDFNNEYQLLLKKGLDPIIKPHMFYDNYYNQRSPGRQKYIKLIEEIERERERKNNASTSKTSKSKK
jgi:hypothetical protein